MSTVTKPKRKPRYKRVRVPSHFNVYDGRVWGSAGDGIRVVFYDGDPAERGDAGIITAVYLPALDHATAYRGVDDWYTTADLPRRIRRHLRLEYPKWLEGVI